MPSIYYFTKIVKYRKFNTFYSVAMDILFPIKRYMTKTGLVLFSILVMGYNLGLMPYSGVVTFLLLNVCVIALGMLMLLSGKTPSEEERIKRQDIIEWAMVLGVSCSMILINVIRPMIETF